MWKCTDESNNKEMPLCTLEDKKGKPTVPRRRLRPH